MAALGERQKKRWTDALLQLLLVAACLLIFLPLMIMLLGSFKDVKEAALLNLNLPSQWHFENYQVVFERGRVGRAFINSMLITVSSVALTTLSASMSSFYMARSRRRFASLLYSVFMLGLIAPMSLIPTIKLMQALSLNNTYPGIIVIFSATNMAFSVLLMTGFIKTIPKELDEAAIIDGCGLLRAFFSVVLPLLKPVVVTSAIVVFMGVWNSFMMPLYFLSASDMWPMPLTVYNFFGQYQSSWNLVFADLTMTAAPIFLVYLIGQRFIIDGMTAGAVKG
jgi:raffinose/stachyose/melibiose transport system permease protein